jgi:3-phosphoshikimate 1-carboxyvinyltransferase
MNTTVSHNKEFSGDFVLSPNREQSVAALTLAALARGRSEFRGLEDSESIQSYLYFLQKIGCTISFSEQLIELEGMGLQAFTSPTDPLPLPVCNYSFLLQCILLARDSESIFHFTGTATHIQNAMQNVLPFIDCEIISCPQDGIQHEDRSALLSLKFKPFSLQEYPTVVDHLHYFLKTRLIFTALFLQTPWALEERRTQRDELFRLMGHFGIPVEIEHLGEMDEIQKRMARMRGVPLERSIKTSIIPQNKFSSRSFAASGDPTQAAFIAALAILTPKANIVIPNVTINPSRSGVFNIMRRMGANIEVKRKSTKQNDVSGDLHVKYSTLKGCRIAGDSIQGAMEELAILAVLAAFAEGESILRLDSEIAQSKYSYLEWIVDNLKVAGCDIGIFEEGLIVRGSEECDAGTFDAHNDPLLALALLVLAKRCQGDSNLENIPKECSYFIQTAQMLGLNMEGNG